MLDIRFIRENADHIKKAAADKNMAAPIDELLKQDQELRQLRKKVEDLQAERNALSKQVAQADAATKAKLIARVSEFKDQLNRDQQELSALEEKIYQLLLLIPQPAREDVPIGRDDRDNVEIKKWGKVPEFSFSPKSHIELGQLHKGIDFQRGVKVAGSRSYILSGAIARLEQAVLRYAYDLLVKRGYMPCSVPVLVREAAMEGTGYFPLGREQAYLAERDEMALVGTAEVSLVGMHTDEILDRRLLPLKYLALSSCFRREAGTYGKDTTGLYRVHQFQKIEQVIFASADKKESEELHSELLGNAEQLLQDLELPYRVVYVCTGDLGQGQVRKHDIETWMPSRQGYGETHSCSTFYDFQARRLNIRYRDDKDQMQICYTLNNTEVASPRILIPLLENHQEADGSIKIPACLRPYMGGLASIKAP